MIFFKSLDHNYKNLGKHIRGKILYFFCRHMVLHNIRMNADRVNAHKIGN